jgi:hypothetical protein
MRIQRPLLDSRTVRNAPTSNPGGQIIVRYFYTWTPLVIVGTVVLLALPWLALIALVVFSLVALAALAELAWAIVSLPYTLGRGISRHWQSGSGAHQPSAALSLAERKNA